MNPLDLSVIILTFNEELHIERCLTNVMGIAKSVYLVDSFSTDRTLEIANELGAKVFQNAWENNHAKQLNWGLDNIPIETEWVLRLDADEFLTEELKSELRDKLHQIPCTTTGLVMKRKQYFLGKWMRRGVYPVKMLRIFRSGKARCEQRLMDEHIELLEGRTIELNHDFVDENLNDLTWWTNKHNGYAIRESMELLDVEFNLWPRKDPATKMIGVQASRKRLKKLRYCKLPLFWRAFAYFVYRYFIKLGFLDGKQAFCWHFFQGWWYRTLVDAKIYEVKTICGNDREKILDYIARNFDVSID